MNKTVNTNSRFGYLDASRGIAATMVMIYHYTGWHYPDKLSVKLSHFVFNGSDAVSFFFVLSGFVLSYPYLQKNKPLDVGKFYLNRIYRIYPAFLIALLLTVLFSSRADLMNAPLDTVWNLFISNKEKVWEEALLIRGRMKYLGLDWTLSIEMAMSFFIPFIMAMVIQNKRLIIWFTLSTFLISYVIGIYVFPFALGMLACVYFKEIQSPEFKQTSWFRHRYWLLFVAIVLFSIRHIDRVFPFGEKVSYVLGFLQIDFFTLSAFASFVFLVFIIHAQRAQRFLEHPFLLFLGKISYGVYLLHWVIVSAIFTYWDRILSVFPNETSAFVVMLFVCSLLTILLATALHYWVELPYINKGKRITATWKETIMIEKK